LFSVGQIEAFEIDTEDVVKIFCATIEQDLKRYEKDNG